MPFLTAIQFSSALLTFGRARWRTIDDRGTGWTAVIRTQRIAHFLSALCNDLIPRASWWSDGVYVGSVSLNSMTQRRPMRCVSKRSPGQDANSSPVTDTTATPKCLQEDPYALQARQVCLIPQTRALPRSAKSASMWNPSLRCSTCRACRHGILALWESGVIRIVIKTGDAQGVDPC